ncbi:class III signal peptide-containing protein [Methanobacterium alkalithermotolerans]|uniref:Class III signal peptide-containing protein n=1 Tax=Methanobacterium alkalithermotolerans TaxID=2731220 RepID=A0A8T8K4Z9_9EURY|nr:class III signal peptide-containing protein [Methanobacterium alkalithermotolerans]QUH22989.1 class III signal peptide-containing protein [Methanobacterium alkalithermotolerans]
MLFIIDEKGQGSAELILIFGGMIVIVIVAAIYYQNYLTGLGDEIIKTDVENVTNQINNLTKKF